MGFVFRKVLFGSVSGSLDWMGYILDLWTGKPTNRHCCSMAIKIRAQSRFGCCISKEHTNYPPKYSFQWDAGEETKIIRTKPEQNTLVCGSKPFILLGGGGGQLTKTTQKPRLFCRRKTQAKAAADAWAAEASEAAKRAKGKVEHGGWKISADDKSGSRNTVGWWKGDV